MKKKCAWLLMLVLLMTSLLSNVAFATGDESEAPASEETAEETEVVLLPATEVTDPKEALAEALTKSPLGADEAIATGVYIDKIDVGGMTAEQALDAVLAHVTELGKKTLTVTLDGAEGVEPLETEMSELGIHTEGLAETVMEAVALGKSGNLIVRYKAEKDLLATNQRYELKLAVDENLVKNFIAVGTSTLTLEPVDAEISYSDGEFHVTQSKTGIKVNSDATVAAILTV